MNTELMFSSNDQTWETPTDFFKRLDLEFKFDIDVCAFPETAKCPRYFTPEINGLAQSWAPLTCWMNPPYDQTARWIEKAYSEALKGAIVVCLIPARTDTQYYHDFCMRASEIRYVKGRLKFGNSKNSAPFPSAVVIFNYYNWDGFLRTSSYEKGRLQLISFEPVVPIRFMTKY
jgi:site-specific DNA-methyltransferase (adenine-specific)